MSETPANPIDAPETPAGPPRAGGVLLRVLAALLVVAGAIALESLWLSEPKARDTQGAKVRRIEIDSELLGRTMPVRVVTPKGAPSKDRSLVVFLHGRGENERSYLVDPMFEALAKLRRRAPVVAFPRSGPSSYWHDRESGPWASYVLDEVLPRLVDRFKVDPSRVAIGGVSMGGFGALDIARLAPGRFCAVGAHSPAIWQQAGETADGAFDDAADFERNDVIALAASDPSPFAGPRIWLDAGESDPFLDGDRAFEEALRGSGLRPSVHHWPGGHDSGYWNEHWDDYLSFYSRSIKNCPRAVLRIRAEQRRDSRRAGREEDDRTRGQR